jgi:hypothetical protein
MSHAASIDLYWLPLGAGGSPVVRASGRAYERLAARRAHRPPRDLFHSALVVRVDDHEWAIEMAPVWSCAEPQRGVVAEGSVGSRVLGLSRWFRYEVRRWQGGVIPDAAYVVGDTVDVPTDRGRAERLLELVHAVPTPVWGRDELGAGEMWNSNSVVSWLLAGSGHDTGPLRPPRGGRAPGWDAGVRLAPARSLVGARV